MEFQMNITYLKIFFNELFNRKRVERLPECEIMEDKRQVEEFAKAGFATNSTLASHIFNVAHISQTIYGSDIVVDLGCGSAIQLIKLAQYHPKTKFIGVDMSDEMLSLGNKFIESYQVQNVTLIKGDITDLSFIKTFSVDAVISTMTLHHLQSIDELKQCFQEINRILKIDGALFLTDFCRLKSEKSMKMLVDMNSKHVSDIVLEDYMNSLRASFSVDEYKNAMKELRVKVKFANIFMIPIFGAIYTKKRKIPAKMKKIFSKLKTSLPKKLRNELDDMSTFFFLGGLEGNPFGLD